MDALRAARTTGALPMALCAAARALGDAGALAEPEALPPARAGSPAAWELERTRRIHAAG